MVAAETWAVNANSALKMPVYRKMLRVSSTRHCTYEYILEEVNTETKSITKINKKVLRYFDHKAKKRKIMKGLTVKEQKEKIR